MRVIFFEVTPTEEKNLRELLPHLEATYVRETLSQETVALAEGFPIISTFINSSVTAEVLGALPETKLLVTRSVGYDHIDCAAAEARGIMVANTPGYGSHTVAEFAFALLLAVVRKVGAAQAALKEGRNEGDMRGMELFGKTLGVVGTGRIGRCAIDIGKGFGMKVVAYDQYPQRELADKSGFTYTPLPELLGGADVVTLHIPYTKESHHLIGRSEVVGMKRGAVLINTARGEIVDARAVVWGLQEGILGGVGLDVFEGERDLARGEVYLTDREKEKKDPMEIERQEILRADLALMRDPRVVATPHIAYLTGEAEGEILKIAAKTITAFVEGSPVNIVKV